MKTIASILLAVLLFTFIDSKGAHLNPDHTTKPLEAPKKVVRDFLKWYKENRERLGTFRLVPVKPGDTTKSYRVDFRETEKYLSELKKSGFVSDQYIISFRKYFETADANLAKYPQYDGPAVGFGFDLVLKAHDYGEILDHLNKLKFVIKPVNADSTKVYVRFPTVIMALTLSRSGSTWLIDSLDYV
ncbi:hypothetical protein GZH53_10520 [Flavihumibacter sp. R14]|nr:hypothetical protein [Flavihumibacter soli]